MKTTSGFQNKTLCVDASTQISKQRQTPATNPSVGNTCCCCYNCGHKWLCDYHGNSLVSWHQLSDSAALCGLKMQLVGVARWRIVEIKIFEFIWWLAGLCLVISLYLFCIWYDLIIVHFLLPDFIPYISMGILTVTVLEMSFLLRVWRADNSLIMFWRDQKDLKQLKLSKGDWRQSLVPAKQHFTPQLVFTVFTHTIKSDHLPE